ncbi:MAG: hypothetical protein DMG13_31300 [Acidobacteria bacterium]|nr:MAG: hypothetical protein DMG13_31300 [Acidobacteriota bacterium]
MDSIYRGKPIFDGCALSRLNNLSPLPGLHFAHTETTAFSRGYVLTPLRGSFRLIRNSSSSGGVPFHW